MKLILFFFSTFKQSGFETFELANQSLKPDQKKKLITKKKIEIFFNDIIPFSFLYIAGAKYKQDNKRW